MKAFDPRLPLIAKEAGVKTCHAYHCHQAMQEMGKAFHIDAFAQFAGLEPRHVKAIVAALTAHNALPAAKRAAPMERGSRLDSLFTVPESWIAWAVQERGWSPADATQEGRAFVDYWIGVSGAKGVKVDWEATWRNSVRRSYRPNGTHRPSEKRLSALEIAHMELRTAEMLGQSYEADQARKKIAALSNVVQFKAAC